MRIHICEYARPDEVQILPPDAKICPWCGSDLEVEALRAQFSDLEQELETWKTNAQDVHEGNDKLRERLSEYDAKYSADMERMESIAKGLSMKLDAANARVREMEGQLAQKDTEIRNLELQIKHPQGGFCSYCGHHFEYGSAYSEDARKNVVEHMSICEAAPFQRIMQPLMLILDWMNSNVPEMECRGDEDCDHCAGLQLLEPFNQALANSAKDKT